MDLNDPSVHVLDELRDLLLIADTRWDILPPTARTCIAALAVMFAQNLREQVKKESPVTVAWELIPWKFERIPWEDLPPGRLRDQLRLLSLLWDNE